MTATIIQELATFFANILFNGQLTLTYNDFLDVLTWKKVITETTETWSIGLSPNFAGSICYILAFVVFFLIFVAFIWLIKRICLAIFDLVSLRG